MLAFELLAKLRILTLWGQNYDGELEWVGKTQDWNALAIEEEDILRTYQALKDF